jgi:urease accessory protein
MGALALAAAEPTFAHTGQHLPGGFATGFMHPISGLDHLLAMAAVGIWGAFLGRPLIWVLPIAFPLMMVVGAVIGIAQISVPGVEHAIAASVLVLGAVIAAAWRAPIAIAVALVAAFAFFHGYAHGLELPAADDAAAYAAGFVVATGMIHLAGIAFGLLLQLPGGIYALRGGGAAIALAGAWIMAGVLGVA